MKQSLGFVFILSSILVSTRVSAVQLEQGWYVKWGWAILLGDEPISHLAWGTDWNPASSIGTFGNLEVKDGQELFSGRTVTIKNNFTAVPGVLFTDHGNYITSFTNYYTQFKFQWQTNYDATKLQMQVRRTRLNNNSEIVWTQNLSGNRYGGFNLDCYFDPFYSGETFSIEMIVVPEPSSISLIAVGVLVLPCFQRRLIV